MLVLSGEGELGKQGPGEGAGPPGGGALELEWYRSPGPTEAGGALFPSRVHHGGRCVVGEHPDQGLASRVRRL